MSPHYNPQSKEPAENFTHHTIKPPRPTLLTFSGGIFDSKPPEYNLIVVRKILFIIAGLTVALAAKAQSDVQFSDFTRLKYYYNPGASGTDGLLNVAAAYSMQFVGFDDAPKTLYVGADIPVYFLNSHHGAGINLFSDDFGMFNQQKISIQYAYNFNISKKTKLAIGAQFGMMQEKIDPSGVELEDGSDPAFPSSQVEGNHADFGAGIYVYNPKFWGGISSLHLAAPTIVLNERYEFNIERMYYLMGGCNIKLKNTFLSLQPSFMVMTDLDNWREDIQCRVNYEWDNKSMFIGAGYSPNVSATLLVGGNFHGVSLCYSYQMYTSGINLVNGTHELTLGYQANLDLFKKGRNKHKSVRFL